MRCVKIGVSICTETFPAEIIHEKSIEYAGRRLSNGAKFSIMNKLGVLGKGE